MLSFALTLFSPAVTPLQHKPRPDPKAAYARPPRTPDPVLAPNAGRKELKYYGAAACRAMWKQRPQDIIRIYVDERTVADWGDVLKWAAAQRKAYHVVTDEDLERLTESIHHQGICVLALERPRLQFADVMEAEAKSTAPMMLAYVDGIGNPHNLGAMVRSCAHFGIRYVLGERDRLPRLAPSACRVAEGAAEHVDLIELEDAQRQFAELKGRGFQLITTTVRAGSPLYGFSFAPRTILVMGAEETGVSGALHQIAAQRLCIPGSGLVESLNVSAAFAVFAGEFYRQHPPREKGTLSLSKPNSAPAQPAKAKYRPNTGKPRGGRQEPGSGK